MSPTVAGRELPEWAAGVLLVALTVSLAGVGDRVLTGAGYPTLGAFFWVVCYAGALVVVWFAWLRHIEFTAPTDG